MPFCCPISDAEHSPSFFSSSKKDDKKKKGSYLLRHWHVTSGGGGAPEVCSKKVFAPAHLIELWCGEFGGLVNPLSSFCSCVFIYFIFFFGSRLHCPAGTVIRERCCHEGPCVVWSNVWVDFMGQRAAIRRPESKVFRLNIALYKTIDVLHFSCQWFLMLWPFCWK